LDSALPAPFVKIQHLDNGHHAGNAVLVSTGDGEISGLAEALNASLLLVSKASTRSPVVDGCSGPPAFMSESDAKTFIERAINLRKEGRLDEALLAARKAVSLDAEDADTWWQLGLTQKDKKDTSAAVASFRKVVSLAPDFANGWYQYGYMLQLDGDLDEAIDAYEQALEHDDEHYASMRMLAFALKQKDEDDADVGRRRLALLRRLFEHDALDRDDTFDLGYLLTNEREYGEAAVVYEKFTREHSADAAYYNLALCYRGLGRYLDALDAMAAASRNGFVSEKLDTARTGVLARLRPLQQKLLARPHPPLPKEDWFRHYVNPFTLLGVEPQEVADNPKSLQKARQALLREIELEEGRVDWLPGLVIDKSSAISRLVELDNPQAWRAHEQVWNDDALNDFLMRGDLRHFLAADDDEGHELLVHELDESLLEVIGPKFAAQFDTVLSRACERREFDVVATLLGGRRWVLSSQQDACFQSTRRMLDRLMEPLQRLRAAAEVRSVSYAEVESALNKDGLRTLIELLPVEFHETHAAVCSSLRSLSVSFYNKEADAETAKRILALGKACAAKSPALTHQYTEDEATLNKFIAEEKADEARMTFDGKPLTVTKAGVTWGDRKLAPKDITGLRWGLVQTSNQPPTVRHTVAFQARRGADIEVSWTTSRNLAEQEKLWKSLLDATFAYIVDAVVADFLKSIERGETLRVGSVPVHRTGVTLTAKGWFSDKEVVVPWSNLRSTLSNGTVVLQDANNPKATANLAMEATYNAGLLHMIAKRKDR
jgi:tetratricopeptide (TPR) repeat protein